ncbi:hypothetical protein MNBD_GAMMA07-879, partial [hydrothermal vent metagenome]
MQKTDAVRKNWVVALFFVPGIATAFIDLTPWLFPLSTLFLSSALIALTYLSDNKRSGILFLFGITGSGLLVFSKFIIFHEAILMASVILLTGLVMWNIWPRNEPRRKLDESV